MGLLRAAIAIPLRRLCLATRYSCRGFAAAWRTQAALRYEVYVFAIVIPAGCWVGDTNMERALLIAPE